MVEAADGGLLLKATDGQIWAVQPEEIVKRSRDDQPFAPLTAEELSRQLLAEMPDGFQIHTTAHYVVCFNTSREYAQWCGALYERLYRAFENYWERRGFKLHDPDGPLVALVFDSQASYAEYAKAELGEATGSVIGYYSLRTNRVTMYDLTGLDAIRQAGDRRTTAAQINQILSRPEAERTVATIIHEATHQLAFNLGLQTRFADIPLWVSEGLAVYFETPDLKRNRGWAAIGGVNYVRLNQFRRYLAQRPANSLLSLLTGDDRFRNTATALDAYAEAWALNYYLLRVHPDKYAKYLKQLAEKTPLVNDDPKARLEQFQAVFGDLATLDADFIRQMQRVR